MNVKNQYIQVDGEFAQTRLKFEPDSRIMHLLAGLERQKEELGPIAVELISLLRRLGGSEFPACPPPQANDKP